MVQGSFDGCVNNSVIFSVNKSIKLLASKKSGNINSKGFQIDIRPLLKNVAGYGVPSMLIGFVLMKILLKGMIRFTVIKAVFS